ncbi:hypothetical protein WDW89_13660 [Deltaproteobacteria bacterium TL4]
MKDLQRINIKVLTPTPEGFKAEPFLKILNHWNETEEEWLDIADYLHLQDGPGVVLLGPKRFVSFDRTEGADGILYCQRNGLEGSLKARFVEVLNNGILFAKKMRGEEACPSDVSTETTQLIITINDRKQAPHSEQTARQLGSVIQEALKEVLDGTDVQMSPLADPKELFGYQVKLSPALSLIE